MPFAIVRQDLTKMKVNAIVNAANTALQMGGGVCGAIFNAAGAQELQEACNKLAPIRTGEAVITPGFGLDAKYIIHTAGPVYKDGSQGEEQLLRACYRSSMELAVENSLESIAFPLISSGIYGYPKDQALRVAISEITEFLLQQDLMVYLVVYDTKAFGLSEKLFAQVKSYIDDHLVVPDARQRSSRASEFNRVYEETDVYEEQVSCCYVPETSRRLEDVLSEMDQTFSQHLLRLIDQKGRTDVETYKRANVDRKLFSKIRKDIHYKPSKSTAIAFAIALELSLDETQDLLSKAGFVLSSSSKFDLIIAYFIGEGSYNIHEINETLFAFDQPLLGA